HHPEVAHRPRIDARELILPDDRADAADLAGDPRAEDVDLGGIAGPDAGHVALVDLGAGDHRGDVAPLEQGGGAELAGRGQHSQDAAGPWRTDLGLAHGLGRLVDLGLEDRLLWAWAAGAGWRPLGEIQVEVVADGLHLELVEGELGVVALLALERGPEL